MRGIRDVNLLCVTNVTCYVDPYCFNIAFFPYLWNLRKTVCLTLPGRDVRTVHCLVHAHTSIRLKALQNEQCSSCRLEKSLQATSQACKRGARAAIARIPTRLDIRSSWHGAKLLSTQSSCSSRLLTRFRFLPMAAMRPCQQRVNVCLQSLLTIMKPCILLTISV